MTPTGFLEIVGKNSREGFRQCFGVTSQEVTEDPSDMGSVAESLSAATAEERAH